MASTRTYWEMKTGTAILFGRHCKEEQEIFLHETGQHVWLKVCSEKKRGKMNENLSYLSKVKSGWRYMMITADRKKTAHACFVNETWQRRRTVNVSNIKPTAARNSPATAETRMSKRLSKTCLHLWRNGAKSFAGCRKLRVIYRVHRPTHTAHLFDQNFSIISMSGCGCGCEFCCVSVEIWPDFSAEKLGW